MTRLAALLLLAACSPYVPPPPPWEADAGEPVDAGDDTPDPDRPRFDTTFDPATGVFRSIVDARDDIAAPLDLDTGLQVPLVDEKWDIAFERFQVPTRGGVSGSGGVRVAPLADTDFTTVTRAPTDGWLEDAPDGEDGNDVTDTVLSTQAQWFSYDVAHHTLSPKPYVYVIRSDSGAYFKLAIDGYYDVDGTYAERGTSAILTIRWAPVEPPPEP